MGFCFFNNVAVAAHAVLKHPGIKRVLVLDWDVSVHFVMLSFTWHSFLL
jgi:acetoin utilization deacetylase AcuC-like enzyme